MSFQLNFIFFPMREELVIEYLKEDLFKRKTFRSTLKSNFWMKNRFDNEKQAPKTKYSLFTVRISFFFHKSFCFGKATLESRINGGREGVLGVGG